MSHNSLVPLFQELNKQLTRENYQKSIDICNKILEKQPSHADAIKTKCVCFIRMNKFDKALVVAKQSGELVFEQAYCQYRLKNLEDALQLIDAVSPKTTAMLQLEAQAYYRLNRYEKCVEVYELLLSNASNADDIVELHANLLAAYTAAGMGRRGIEHDIEDTEETYEIAYNRACACIQNGHFEAAEKELRNAETLCRQMLMDEGCKPEEIQNEVAIILVQSAFIYHVCGQQEKALSMYREVLQSKPSDVSVIAVASNNIVALRNDKDVFDSLKRFKGLSLDALSEKLLPSQQEVIGANRALLFSKLNKGVECREALAWMEKHFPNSELTPKIMVSLLLKERNMDGCIALLKEKHDSIPHRLMLAQVYLIQGERRKAIDVLSSISSIRHAPAMVATLVALHSTNRDTNKAIAVLQESLQYHEQQDPTSERKFKIIEGDAAFKLSKGKYKEAADGYSSLLDDEASMLDGDSRIRALASLVVALSYVEPKTAEARGLSLPPLEETSISPDELEKQAPRVAKTRVSRIVARVADIEEKQKERKRANRNPEKIQRKRAKRREKYIAMLKAKPDYNASIGLMKPDPERWIPRKQRSYAKRGRRGRNKFVGAQGAGMGTQKDAAKLDAAARASQRRAEAEAMEEKKGTVATGKTSAVQRKSKKKKRR